LAAIGFQQTFTQYRILSITAHPCHHTYPELAEWQELKDISTLVRKHWRCGYVECSAQ